jgi:adenosine deaminase
MRKIWLLLLVAASCAANAQSPMDRYFERIRNNEVELSAFFSEMPKGGDLHNHFSGSIYAETYINYVVGQDYVINENTLEVRAMAPAEAKGWISFSKLNAQGLLPAYKQKLMQKWSVKDYNGVSYPSDKQFFETFSGFGVANNTIDRWEAGLLELKQRAKKENVSYIETMFTSIPCGNLKIMDTGFNHRLEDAQNKRNEAQTTVLLEQLYTQIEAKNVKACAAAFNNDVVAALHNKLHIDDSTFTMRYQNYVVRVVPPVDVFKSLVLAFESANTSPLIVGVNIVAPEDNEVSMRDYWLHVQMFRFCHQKFPGVKYSMHAGELTLGLVKPEELTWHINEAVRTAGANRIGHGVDMAYEHNSADLLRYMSKNNIAIEINLFSNEFILKVKDDAHPISLYEEFGVPIVICTDDAGVLRSNLTHQYVLLAKRYKNISYEEIKHFVFNSIDYSFIEEDAVKEKLKAQLRTDFRHFEKEVLATHLNSAY